MFKSLILKRIGKDNFIHMILGIILIATYTKLYLLAGDDIFNNYPFMFPDSFDWLYNGIYYLEKFIYKKNIYNRIPREILLPLIAAISYYINFERLILIILFIINFLGFIYGIRICRLLNIRSKIILFFGISYVFHYGMNFFKIYLLSDSLTVYLNIISTFYFLKYLKAESFKDLIIGSIISSFSSISAKYGIFPAFTINLFLAWSFLFTKYKKPQRIILLKKIFVSSLISLSLPALWLIFKKIHYGSISVGPNQVLIIKFNLNNLEFYFNVLTVFFMPFILVIFFASISKIERIKIIFQKKPKDSTIYLSFISLLTLFSIFIYQWQEARFTSYAFFYIIFLFLILFNKLFFGRKRITVFLLIFLWSNLVPYSNLMRPKINKYLSNITNIKSFYLISLFFNTKKQDRFNLNMNCGQNRGYCLDAKKNIPKDYYMNYTFNKYLCYKLQIYPCK